MNYVWNEVRDIVQHRDQDHPHGKEMQKIKEKGRIGGITKTNGEQREQKDTEQDEQFRIPLLSSYIIGNW